MMYSADTQVPILQKVPARAEKLLFHSALSRRLQYTPQQIE